MSVGLFLEEMNMQYYLLGIAIGVILLNALYANIRIWEVQE